MSPLKKPVEFETTFSRYQATEIIGQGGTGRVYKASSDAGGDVAIKVLDADKGSASERRRRFKNELLFGERNQHPNVLTVLDHGSVRLDGGASTPFYVMPLYDSSLRELMRVGISPDTVLQRFGQIIDGVEAAHLQGIVHRDLKPENILYAARADRLVVADFGIAEFTREELYTLVETQPGTRLASFQYAAPEQRARGARTDSRSDIFALGLILNEMVTGAIAHGTGYRTIGSVTAGLSYLDELVERMIRHQADDRPPSIEVIKRELQARHNDFIERQKLSALRQIVVPASDLDDPIALDPIRVVDFDWEKNVLTLKLNRPVNTDWIQAIQFGPYGRSSIMGKGPEAFQFRGDTAVVSAQEREVQDVINYFKGWLAPAHQIYVQRLTHQRREEEERQRNSVKQEIEESEKRRRVLAQVKI